MASQQRTPIASLVNDTAFEFERIISLDKTLQEVPSWNNEILHLSQGQHYTQQAEPIIDTVGRYWLRGMYRYTSTSKLDKYTVLLALHLRAPTARMEYIFNVKFQRPTPQDAKHPVTGADLEPNFFHSREELKDLLQEADMAEIESELKKSNATLDSNLKAVEEKLEQLSQKKRAAFYAFLAAMTCRIVVKSPENVQKQWENLAVKMFCRFYSVQMDNVRLPPPSEIGLKSFQNATINPKSYLTIAIYKAFLNAKEDYTISNLGKVKDLLDFTLLTPTAMNGIAIISMCYEAARQVEFSRIEDFFDGVQCQGTKKSIGAVREFIKEYNSSVSDFKDKNWFYWARIIQPGCFLSLALKEHTFLAGFCACLIEGGLTGPTWKAAGLKHLDSYSKTAIWKGLEAFLATKSVIKKPAVHYSDLFTL